MPYGYETFLKFMKLGEFPANFMESDHETSHLLTGTGKKFLKLMITVVSFVIPWSGVFLVCTSFFLLNSARRSELDDSSAGAECVRACHRLCAGVI